MDNTREDVMDAFKAGNKNGFRVRSGSFGDWALVSIALLSVCTYGMYIILAKGLFGSTGVYFFIDGVPKTPFGALIYLSVVLIAIGTVMAVRYKHRLEMNMPFLYPEFRTIRILATALPLFALATMLPTILALGYLLFSLVRGY